MKKTATFIFLVILSLISLSTCAGELVTNGDFSELSDGLPVGWSHGSQDASVSAFSAKNGAMQLSAQDATLTYVTQDIYVDPGQNYRFSAEIKTSHGASAYLGFLEKAAYSDAAQSSAYEKTEIYFITDEAVVPIMLMLGNYTAPSSGDAWFKNVVIEPVDSVPQGALYYNYTNQAAPGPAPTGDFDMRWLWLVVATVAVLIFSITYLCIKK